MTLSHLPLSYCTNVHPGRTVAEVLRGLQDFTVPAQQEFGAPVAAGLWLAQPVAQELLQTADGVRRFADRLGELGLRTYTLNAFPYGDFHSARVKEQVYLPDWTQPARRQYTESCAKILAELIPEGVEGSISTVPLGFKGFLHPVDFQSQCAQELLTLTKYLERLYSETGRRIRLAIEPEPFCVLETTPETRQFFAFLRQQAESAGLREALDEYIGICFDVCHQAVEYEDISDCFRQLAEDQIRINKLHITCALQLDKPAENLEARQALAQYAEQRYLHQTIAPDGTGGQLRSIDLTPEMALNPPAEFLQAESWRIHFHVPVNAEKVGPLSTTRPQLQQALREIPHLSYAPHLEVETYTWEVLPNSLSAQSPESLIHGLSQELRATRDLVASLNT
ncbi:MAG: metabolite traffic protein EboE [Planctomycetota bacterium]